MAALDADEALQAFVSQARKCESFASDDPDGYRWRVAALAVLGYAFPPAVLLVLSGAFAAGVWYYAANGYHGGSALIGKLGIALLLLVGMVGRAMWPRFGAPDGIRLRRDDAPDLYGFIDEVREKAGGPTLHRVYVTDQMNAAVRQTPRLGFFGWYRNDLILGLPLLMSLTRDEVAAVIAHEFGHLSGAHGKLGAWIYRSRLSMARILEAIEERRYFGSGIFLRFYRWYEPFFAAYSFTLAREQEYEADRMAAEAVSSQAAVDALARVSIACDYLQQVFWNDVWQDVERMAEPPKLVYGKLGIALVSLNKWNGLDDSFKASVGERTDYADTHPSMSDRARALGIEPRIPPTINNAAAWLLPNDGAELVVEFSQRWQAEASPHWTERHEEIQAHMQRLAALDEAAEKSPLSLDDAMERGFLAERFTGREAALMRFEQALTWTGNTAPPLFQIARILLSLGRDEGLACLKQVIELDDDSIVPACELAESYLNDAGRGGEATEFLRRRKAHQEILDADRADRSQIGRADTLFPHECDEAKLETTMRVIGVARKKGLRRAWMVRKATEHRTWEPAYFLVCDFGTYRRSEEDIDALLTEMVECLDGHRDVCVLLCDPGERWLPTKVSMVANAKLFPQ